MIIKLVAPSTIPNCPEVVLASNAPKIIANGPKTIGSIIQEQIPKITAAVPITLNLLYIESVL